MGAVENVKEIADLIGKFHDIELNRRILKLEEEVLDLARAKRRLEERVEELESTLRFKGEVKFARGFYWKEGDPEPYCAGCWDSKKILAHVTASPVFPGQKICPVCKHSY